MFQCVGKGMGAVGYERHFELGVVVKDGNVVERYQRVGRDQPCRTHVIGDIEIDRSSRLLDGVRWESVGQGVEPELARIEL